MNKFINFELGGYPLTNDTFEHILSGAENDVFAIVESLFKDDIQPFRLLTGFEITNTIGEFYTWSSGFCLIDGKIHKIDEQLSAVEIVGGLTAFGVYPIDVPSDFEPTTYENGTTVDSHFIRKVEFKDALTNAGSIGTMFDLSRFLALEQLTLNIISNDYNKTILNQFIVNDGWVSLASHLGANITEIEPVQYRIVDNLVEFRGVLSYTGTSNNFNIFTNTFPNAIRPSREKHFVIGLNQGGDRFGTFLIDDANNTPVSMVGYTYAGTNVDLIFDNIKYYKI